MLRVLQSQIDSYRAEIEKLFAQHPDHDLFGSLPGAGPKIAPRLLGEIIRRVASSPRMNPSSRPPLLDQGARFSAPVQQVSPFNDKAVANSAARRVNDGRLPMSICTP